MSEQGEAMRAAEAKVVATSRELRRRRARALAIGFGVWVALPTTIAAVYYGAIASRQYESIAILTIESSEQPATREGDGGLLPHAGSGRDVQVARSYVRSRAMLDALDQGHGFVAHYQDPSIDRWSRLASGASREKVFAYFKDHVLIDDDSGTLTLRVRAFSGAKATELATAVIADAEKMMNELSGRAQKDQLALAESDVKEARARLDGALAALAADGDKPGTDPRRAAPSEALVVEKDLARRSLETALGSLERGRAEAAHQRRYLIAVAPPSVPDEATYPRRLWNVATVFVLALALAGVISLLGAAVREHARF